MQLYATSRAGGFVIGHDGGNMPAINTTVRIEPASGDAIIALSTGGKTIASRLGTAWLMQRQVKATPFQTYSALYMSAIKNIAWIGGGLLALLILGIVFIVRARRAG